MLTQAKLKEVLDYDPETGIFRWKEIFSKKVKKGDIAGTIKDGYRIIRFNSQGYMAHRLAWLYVHGYLPENEIDHINRIKNDNRISNLREVSRSCNMRNTGNMNTNTSGVKGVYYPKKDNMWRAHIAVNGNKYHFYYGKSFDEAVLHRLAAEQCLDWQGCDSSSPAYQYYLKHIKGDE